MKNDDKQFNYSDRVGITGIPVNNNVIPLYNGIPKDQVYPNQRPASGTRNEKKPDPIQTRNRVGFGFKNQLFF